MFICAGACQGERRREISFSKATVLRRESNENRMRGGGVKKKKKKEGRKEGVTILLAVSLARVDAL